MKIYKKRDSKEYITKLKQLLSVENAKDNAFIIKSEKKVSNKTYDKCIKVDFIGIAGSTLFDTGRISANQNVFKELKELLNQTKSLNEDGYFLKLRFLLEYPYSISAYTRIQAEYTRRRSCIEEPIFQRNLTLTEQVDKEIFEGSTFVSTQKSMLRQVQELYEELYSTQLWNSDIGPNKFAIRFTPVSPGMCCLFINNHLFYDIYTLAKEKRTDNRCRPFCPITEITKKGDAISFLAFEDHFRYLWDLDITMDCEDATYFSIGVTDSLSKIKPPHQINFLSKVGRLKSKLPNTKEKEFNIWSSGINRLMNRFCANLSPTPSSESIFITCSWEEKPGLKPEPHRWAQELYADLQDDLNDNISPIASVKILEAALTEFLSNELYSTMEDSTIGIIILTKDIEAKDGKFYSKPNVYHELGYMMKHLTRNRMMILAESGVTIPSNIQNIVRLDFDGEKLSLIYRKIILQIQKITLLDDKVVNKIMGKLLQRLNIKMEKKEISPDEYNGVKNKIEIMNQKKDQDA